MDKKEKVSEIRKTRGGAILDMDDKLFQVLDDNDFVSVGMSRIFWILIIICASFKFVQVLKYSKTSQASFFSKNGLLWNHFGGFGPSR